MIEFNLIADFLNWVMCIHFGPHDSPAEEVVMNPEITVMCNSFIDCAHLSEKMRPIIRFIKEESTFQEKESRAAEVRTGT